MSCVYCDPKSTTTIVWCVTVMRYGKRQARAVASRESRYYKRVVRATATTAAGLVAGIGLLALHASPIARTAQAPPAARPAPAWEIELDPLNTLQVAAGSAAVYVLEAGGAVRARAVDGDGAVRWTYQATSQPSLLWGAERVLLIEPGLVTALDAATGAIAWTDRLPAGDAVATVVDGVLAVGVGTGLFLFNAADGARLSSAGLDVPLQAPPVLAGQDIVVAMQNGALAGIDRETGRRSWTRPPLATPVDGLAAHDGRAYVSGRDGNLYCVQTHNGELSWTYSLYARLSGAASASGGLLYVALFDNTVQAFDRRTGTRQWSQPLTGRPASPVWPAGTRLIVAQADGVLAVLDAAAGTQQTRLAPPGEARLLEHAGPVPGTPGAVFTVTTGTSSVRRLGLWRLDP
jgi:outer membrane protein assembly factor BamB